MVVEYKGAFLEQRLALVGRRWEGGQADTG